MIVRELKPEERTWVDDLYDEAVEKGERKGELKGKLEGKLEAIRNMLKEGISFPQITRWFGFSESELRGLLA